jgi:hypothetical protein
VCFRVRNTSSLGEVAVIAQIRHWLGAVAPSHPGSRLHERSCIVYSSRPLNTVRRLKSRGVAHYTFCASIREYPLLATVRDFAPFPSIRATVRVSMTACCNNAAVFCIDKRRVLVRRRSRPLIISRSPDARFSRDRAALPWSACCAAGYARGIQGPHALARVYRQ